MNVTLSNIINFICWNRVGTNAFQGWTAIQIASEVTRAITNKSCIVDIDAKNNILGIVVAEPNHDYHVMHIKGILIHPKYGRGTLRRMVRIFNELYPNWDIQAFRGGDMEHIIIYPDSTRLCKLLTLISK